jgi:hypothetical protein
MLGACGSAASYNYELPPSVADEEPTLARMEGYATGEPIDADPRRLRVALVWFPVLPSAGKVQISQQAKLREHGLGHFAVDIARMPPDAAIEPVGRMRYAQAEVILYEDRNDNDNFDLVNAGGPLLDRVVGRAPEVRVWWLDDGDPAPPEQRGYKPVQEGWSFTYGPIITEPDVRSCDPGREMGDTFKPVCRDPVITPAKDVSGPGNRFTMTRSNDPKLQSYACRGFWGTSSEKSDRWPDTTPGWNSPEVRNKICNAKTCDCQGADCELDLPVRDVRIDCNSDETIYSWEDCEPDPKLCGTVFCHKGSGARDPNQPKPSNWPVCSNK